MKVSIADTFDPTTVDLWDHEFETVPVTRSVREKLAKTGAEIGQAMDTEDADKLVAAIGAALDVRLKSSDAKRKLPSELIAGRWEADKLDIHRLLAFVEEVGASSVRPF